MDLQTLARESVESVFTLFPSMSIKKIDDEEYISCKALQSFIALTAQTEGGLDIHGEYVEVSISIQEMEENNFTVALDDKVTVLDFKNVLRDFIVKTNDPDNTLGIHLLKLEAISDNSIYNGVIDDIEIT